MKSWRENDVAAKKAAKRPKSGKCQLGSGPLVRAKRRAEMKNGGKYVGRPGMRTRGGFLFSSCTSFADGDWIAQKKTNQRSTKPQTSKATGRAK